MVGGIQFKPVTAWTGRSCGTRGTYLLGFIGTLQEGLILLILQLLVLQLEVVALRLKSPR
jgi:hypothetical protein